MQKVVQHGGLSAGHAAGQHAAHKHGLCHACLRRSGSAVDAAGFHAGSKACVLGEETHALLKAAKLCQVP